MNKSLQFSPSVKLVLNTPVALLVAATSILSLAAFAPGARADEVDRETARIAKEIRKNSTAYENLKALSALGPRLCGSSDEARAIEWAKRALTDSGAANVRLQAVTVPHWTRGNVERLVARSSPAAESKKTTLSTEFKITSLGLSVGTPKGGLQASAVEVHSLDEVKKLGPALKGKIVFFNRPMDPKEPDTFKAYGDAVDQRSSGPAAAAKQGAVAVIVRSMTTQPDDDHPHTGVTDYEDGVPKIPAAAISTHGANLLSSLLKADPELKLKLTLSGELLAPVVSHNVIGEIAGSAKPEEIVDVGGHIDSWDLATGSMDDGPGVVQSIEILRAMHALKIAPNRTLRVVLFTCEEVGGIGGTEYAKQAKALGEKHLLALESDNGGFAPHGFSVHATPAQVKKIEGWSKKLAPYRGSDIVSGDSDTDVDPLFELGTATVGLRVDGTRYFNYHHTSLDRIDVIDKQDLDSGAIAMAALVELALHE